MFTTATKAAALFLVGTLAFTARADEEKISLDKVPAKVMKAVKAKFAGAEATGAAKEVDNGKTTYEVMIKHRDAKIDVSVSEAGEITGYEKAMEVGDLPKAVTAAARKKYPNAKITAAEEIFKDDKSNFEVEVTVKGRKPFEMIISEKGKIVEDEGSAKDEKDEK